MDDQPIADALIRSGREPEAFGAVYRTHAHSLISFIARRVFDLETAADLAGESFAKAYIKRRSFRGHSDAEVAKWLYTIAERETQQFFRKSVTEKRALRKLGIEPPRLSDDDEERILELAGLGELRSLVRQELNLLSVANREALSLRVIEELPYTEVARRLGVSDQAARTRVTRGLRALSKALDNHELPLKEGLV